MTFELYPAIDLLDGKCVRLLKGDYAQETVYRDDPVDQAKSFVDAGATWVHVVDLDAARTGDPKNRAVVEAIASAVEVPVQTGGGVRSVAAAETLFDAGVTRVVMGTAAVENPALVGEVAASGRVAVGLDIKGREVAVRGWQEGSGLDIAEAVSTFESSGADAFIVTQIERDGTLEGPDLDGLIELLALTDVPVVASGDVGRLDDIAALAAASAGGRSLAGVIVGKAIYEGRVSVEDALRAIGEPR